MYISFLNDDEDEHNNMKKQNILNINILITIRWLINIHVVYIKI
jgi:hypothetical protein